MTYDETLTDSLSLSDSSKFGATEFVTDSISFSEVLSDFNNTATTIIVNSDSLSFSDSLSSVKISSITISDSVTFNETIQYESFKRPSFKYDPTNTEGAYPDAFYVEGAELKKGEKIVATDLVDLFDVDINETTLVDGDLLIYEEVSQKWINAEGGGGGGVCVYIDTPPPIFPTAQYKKVSAGASHTLALLEDGTLWACGYNAYGQLGLGHYENKSILTQVGSSLWKDISCEFYFSYAIREDGTLWSCGQNNNGQLGMGDYNNLNIFTQVGNDTDWVKVVAGSNFVLALKENGTLWGCGYNSSFQLGLNDNGQRVEFDQCVFPNGVVIRDFSGGTYHSLAIDTNGILYGTGNAGYGELNGIDASYTFIPLNEEVWLKASAGLYTTYAIKEDGTLWVCGYNDRGQLGMDDYNNLSIFTQVGSDTDWVDVVSSNRYGGNNFSIALKDDGSVWDTGYNYNGQLGLGIYTDQRVYTKATITGTCKYIEAGFNNTFIIKNDDSLWTAGAGSYGKSGLGIDSSFNIFTQVGVQYFDSVFRYEQIYVDGRVLTQGNGSITAPFNSLESCFSWLVSKCIVIPENATMTINIMSNLYVGYMPMNYAYGHRVIINGNNHTISIFSTGGYTDFYSPVYLNNNHSIKEIRDCILKPVIENQLFYIMKHDNRGTRYFEVYSDYNLTNKINQVIYNRFGDVLLDDAGNVVYISQYSEPETGFDYSYKWFQYDEDGNVILDDYGDPLEHYKTFAWIPWASNYEYDPDTGDVMYDEYGNPLYTRDSRISYNIDFLSSGYDGKWFAWGEFEMGGHGNAAVHDMNVRYPAPPITTSPISIISIFKNCFIEFKNVTTIETDDFLYIQGLKWMTKTYYTGEISASFNSEVKSNKTNLSFRVSNFSNVSMRSSNALEHGYWSAINASMIFIENEDGSSTKEDSKISLTNSSDLIGIA